MKLVTNNPLIRGPDRVLIPRAAWGGGGFPAASEQPWVKEPKEFPHEGSLETKK